MTNPSSPKPYSPTPEELENMLSDADDLRSFADPLTYNAPSIAFSAASLVAGQRQAQHGDKADNFSRIAALWQGWLDIRRDPSAPLDAHDIGIMMTLMKLARTQTGSHNIDDYIDACGYAACAGEIAEQDHPK